MTLNARFKKVLEAFPPPVRECLHDIPHTGGMLPADKCSAAMQALNVSAADLMVRLLTVAKLYAVAPISGFAVGAVARARVSGRGRNFALFLGANLEFPGQSPVLTVHAEQAAVVNAWLQGAEPIETLAVTAAPCGYCRQFLYELAGSHKLSVIIPRPAGSGTTKYALTDMLPEAFGPRDLGSAAGLTAPAAQLPDLRLQLPSDDPMVRKALAAAVKAYAPYSHNLAGCAILAGGGTIYTGCGAENAAFNPSLSPVHAAIIRMRMDNLAPENKITRAVLVEKPTAVSQRAVCEVLLQTVAPDVKLEYFEAKG